MGVRASKNSMKLIHCNRSLHCIEREREGAIEGERGERLGERERTWRAQPPLGELGIKDVGGVNDKPARSAKWEECDPGPSCYCTP